MHIAILLAGHTNKAMPERFHDYDDMFTVLFQDLPKGKGFKFTTLAVVDNVFPNHLDEYDGYMIAGSAYGVYDEAPFIARLMDLIRQIHQAKKPLFGVCFGHQIIAHAFGGRVVRADEDSHFVAEVNDKAGKSVFASFAHQEHVVDAGELEVVASAAHCIIAACRHPTRPIFTVQYHPEAVAEVLDLSLACGDMSEEERDAYDHQRLTTNVGVAFALDDT